MNRYNTKTWRLWTLTPRSFKSREKSHWTCLKCRDTPLICLMIPITRWSHSKGKQVYFIPSLYSLFFLQVASSASFKEPTCASSAYVLINATNSCAYLRLSGTRLLLCNGRLRAPFFRIFRLSVWHRPIWRGRHFSSTIFTNCLVHGLISSVGVATVVAFFSLSGCSCGGCGLTETGKPLHKKRSRELK